MKEIKNKEFGGERPLFDIHDTRIEDVVIHAGESALKRCSDIEAIRCRFEGKYPFWHSKNFTITDCEFTEGGRAAIWYSKGCTMRSCKIDAPKMFREMTGIDVADTDFPNGQEMLWDCKDVKFRNVKISNCDYLFSHSGIIDIADYEQHGNYSFQYCHDVKICNAKIWSKDAFWNTKNVTIIDSELNGEYLAWYSEGLTLINCHITGTQPLCYCKGLTLVNCTFGPDADLAFEESDVMAEVNSHITSVKNPRHGQIKAQSVGLVLVDGHAMPDSDCKVEIAN